ncbi:unnamed protein product, partial [Ectocarpus sp. 12 AP-2014]
LTHTVYRGVEQHSIRAGHTSVGVYGQGVHVIAFILYSTCFAVVATPRYKTRNTSGKNTTAALEKRVYSQQHERLSLNVLVLSGWRHQPPLYVSISCMHALLMICLRLREAIIHRSQSTHASACISARPAAALLAPTVCERQCNSNTHTVSPLFAGMSLPRISSLFLSPFHTHTMWYAHHGQVRLR